MQKWTSKIISFMHGLVILYSSISISLLVGF